MCDGHLGVCVFTIAIMFNKGVSDSQTPDSLVIADLKDVEKPNAIYST